MNKRKLFFAMCCLTAVLAIGCGKKNSTDTKNPEQVEKQDNTKTEIRMIQKTIMRKIITIKQHLRQQKE